MNCGRIRRNGGPKRDGANSIPRFTQGARADLAVNDSLALLRQFKSSSVADRAGAFRRRLTARRAAGHDAGSA
jgi:hypothetical protein